MSADAEKARMRDALERIAGSTCHEAQCWPLRKIAQDALQGAVRKESVRDGPDLYWTPKGGERISIKDMKTGHLKNVVAMLRRRGCVTEDEYFSCLAYACSGSTPDGAAMAAEAEAATMRPWAGLALMEEELASRLGSAAGTHPARE